MKALICISLLATLRLGLADPITQARQELLPSLHLGMENVDLQQRSHKFNDGLFEQQIHAIEVVGQFGDASDTELLIPYLDYPGPGAATAMGLTMLGPSVGELKTEWPAFGAISSLPHSTETLYAYALNKSNPIDYRLTALHMLRYLAPGSFDGCIKAIEENEANNTKLQEYLNLIQGSSLPFHGILHHEEVDDWLKAVNKRRAQKASPSP